MTHKEMELISRAMQYAPFKLLMGGETDQKLLVRCAERFFAGMNSSERHIADMMPATGSPEGRVHVVGEPTPGRMAACETVNVFRAAGYKLGYTQESLQALQRDMTVQPRAFMLTNPQCLQLKCKAINCGFVFRLDPIDKTQSVRDWSIAMCPSCGFKNPRPPYPKKEHVKAQSLES